MLRPIINVRLLPIFVLSAFNLMLAIPALSQFGLSRTKNVLTAQATPTSVVVTPGGKAVVNVKLSIQRPYHANANPASEDYLIPTQVSIGATKGLTVGRPLYPKGAKTKFSFSDKPLSVYAGDVTVKVPIIASKQVTAGRRQLSGTVKYQACNEHSCLPPATTKFTIAVRIAGA